MSLNLLTSRDAVREAMAEYDRLGRDRFLQSYGFGPAKSYFIRENGKLYDSKAIAGVAVGKQHPDRGPLRSGDFSGGDSTVRQKFEQLGFEIVRAEEVSHVPLISSDDLRIIGEARASRSPYSQLTREQFEAYRRVDAALGSFLRS